MLSKKEAEYFEANSFLYKRISDTITQALARSPDKTFITFGSDQSVNYSDISSLYNKVGVPLFSEEETKELANITTQTAKVVMDIVLKRVTDDLVLNPDNDLSLDELLTFSQAEYRAITMGLGQGKEVTLEKISLHDLTHLGEVDFYTCAITDGELHKSLYFYTVNGVIVRGLYQISPAEVSELSSRAADVLGANFPAVIEILNSSSSDRLVGKRLDVVMAEYKGSLNEDDVRLVLEAFKNRRKDTKASLKQSLELGMHLANVDELNEILTKLKSS